MKDKTPGDPLGLRKRKPTGQAPISVVETSRSKRIGFVGLALATVLCVVVAFWPKSANPPSRELTSDYLRYLKSLGDNPEALRAADFLSKSGLKIHAAQLSPYERGEAGGHYDNDLDVIIIAPDIGRSVGVNIEHEEFIPLTAGIVVHEIQHAIDFRATGLLASETELLATSRGSRFELYRAQRGQTPAAEALARRIGIKCTPWYSCLPPKEMLLKTGAAAMEGRISDGLHTSQYTQVWIAAAGWGMIQEWVQSMNKNDSSMLSVLGDGPAMAKVVADELVKSPDAMEKIFQHDGIPPAERAKLLKHAKANMVAWADTSRIEAAKKYYLREFSLAKNRFSN